MSKQPTATLMLVVIAILVVAVLAVPPKANGIPAFARKYQTSCTTCHVIPPKLNSFGVAFKNNGYMMPIDDEKFIQQPDVKLGAEGWKKMWPKAVWPGAIPAGIPLSVAVEMEGTITPKEHVKTDFAFPAEFELLAGGTLGPAISYFGEMAFEFSNGETETDFERGHISFRPFRTKLFNLKLGRLETAASPFSRFSFKLTDEDFIVSNFRAVPGGFRFRNRQQGFELWGASNGPGGGGLQYGLGVVNGSGSSNDDNSHKDSYGSVSYKFGGFGVLGPTKSLDSLKAAENYIDNSVEVGAFGYVGRSGATPAEEVRFNRVGFKVNAYLNRLNLFGAYVHGRDLIFAEQRPVTSNAWFVESDVVILPWVVGILRYDQAIGDQSFLRVKRLVPGVAMMIRGNVILTAEVPAYFGDKNSLLNGETVRNRGRFGLVFLF